MNDAALLPESRGDNEGGAPPLPAEASTGEEGDSGSDAEDSADDTDDGADPESERSHSGVFAESPQWRWPRHCAKVLDMPFPLPEVQRPLTVVSLCAGTDAPVLGLQMALGSHNVEHLCSVEKCQAARRFIQVNFRPRHMRRSITDFRAASGMCDVCGMECNGANQHTPADMMIAGFPCPPFSILNPNRFNQNHNGLRQSHTFMEIVSYLHSSLSPPMIVILENVWGTMMKGGAGKHRRPIDGILSQLDALENYLVSPVLTATGLVFGLPVRRRRILILLLRSDIADQGMMNKIACDWGLITAQPLPLCRMTDFLSDVDDDLEDIDQMQKRRRTGPVPITHNAKCQSMQMRREHGLPKFGSSLGHPWSRNASDAQLAQLSLREMETMDLATLRIQKDFDGQVPQDFICDVSQSINRQVWRASGTLPNPSTGSNFWISTRAVQPREVFRMLGWPAGTPVLPTDISAGDARTMIGNMLAPPLPGALAMCVLANLAPHRDTDFRPAGRVCED